MNSPYLQIRERASAFSHMISSSDSNTLRLLKALGEKNLFFLDVMRVLAGLTLFSKALAIFSFDVGSKVITRSSLKQFDDPVKSSR